MAKRYREPAATNKPIGLASGMVSKDEAIRQYEDTARMVESGEMNPPKDWTREEIVSSLRLWAAAERRRKAVR